MLFEEGRLSPQLLPASPPTMGFAPILLLPAHPCPGQAVGALSRQPGQGSSSTTSQRFHLVRVSAGFDQRRRLENRELHSPPVSPLSNSPSRNCIATGQCSLPCSHQLLAKRRHVTQASHLQQSFLFSTHLAASDSASHS